MSQRDVAIRPPATIIAAICINVLMGAIFLASAIQILVSSTLTLIVPLPLFFVALSLWVAHGVWRRRRSAQIAAVAWGAFFVPIGMAGGMIEALVGVPLGLALVVLILVPPSRAWFPAGS